MATQSKKTTTTKAKASTTTRNRKTAKTATKQTVTPSYDIIAERAWRIWMDNGCQPSQDEQNWLEAVAQLESELVSC